jgi:hypothetical protein
MLDKIIHFIKYHNAFTIGLALLFVFSGVIFASEDAREAALGKKVVTQGGIDNSWILAADLDNFDFQMTVQGVKEDVKNYYVDYSYRTLGIQGNAWREVLEEDTLSVSKEAIGGRDLGLYVQEELGEIIDSQLAYLREVQELEENKGQTFVQETTEYTGLIGLVLNPQTKTLPGYEPVVKPPQTNQIVSQEPAASQMSEAEPHSGSEGGSASVAEGVCTNGENRACSSEVGQCQIGVQICEQGVWGECIGSVQPTEELCDGVDNNCNGEVDEGGVCGGITSNSEETSTTTNTITEDSATTDSVVEDSTSTDPTITESTSTDDTATTTDSIADSTSTDSIIEFDTETSTTTATTTD